MARTRRQVTLQEQESGVPASPPQSLPTAPRATRTKRATIRNNAEAPPADPAPSTQGGATVRGSRIGRAKRVGRGRTQQPASTSHTSPHDAPESSTTDVDGPEASDSLPQTEVVVEAPSATEKVLDGHDKREIMERIDVEASGETQSPTGVSAHPVQVQDMTAHPVQAQEVTAHPVQAQEVTAHPVQAQDETAHPVQELTTPQNSRESATSLKFREVLSRSPQSRGSSAGRVTPTAVAPNTPLPLAAFQSTPTPISRASSPSHTSPLPSSPLVNPTPQAPSPASPIPVYYKPSSPEQSQSLITIRMDYFQGSKDPVRSPKPAAFAVPSELVAPICRYIESRAKAGSNLSKLTTDHPAVNAIVHGSARYRPRLPSWLSQQSPPLPGSTMRDAFIRKAQRKRGFRELEEETATLKAENAKLKSHAAGESTEAPPKRTKIVPDPWNADGQLILGRTKEIEVDEYGVAVNPLDEPNIRWNDMEARKKAQLEETQRITNDVGESPYVPGEIPDTDGPALGGPFAESQNQVQPEPVPETPRSRGWGLSKFLPSARSVTKFIPFSSRRTTSTQPPQPQQPTQNGSQPNAGSSQPNADTPQPDAGSTQPQGEPDVANTATGPPRRRHQPTSNQQKLLTKQQSEEEKRLKKMRAQLRRETEALEKQKRDLENAKKDLAEQQKSVELAQTPGQKRKRIPSPEVIPLPAGGGFGLVDEYFIVESSSDEDDTAVQETPTRERPLKKARTSAPSDAIVGSPFRARPYTGTLFAHPDALGSRQDDNVFAKSNKPGVSPASNTTPPPGPTLTFKIPSPESSDSDEDEDEDEGQEQPDKTIKRPSSPKGPPPKSILRNSGSNQSQSRQNVNSPSPSKSMAAPSRPNPSHATLPAVTAMAPPGALEKAREKALKHQPKQPSTLRESSRLSSISTLYSDPGDEDEDIEEYDPTNPGIMQFARRAPASAKPAQSAAPALDQPVVGSTSSTKFQPSVTQAVSKQPEEQQTLPKTTEKQTETLPNVFANANDVQSGGQAVEMVEEHTKVLDDSQQTKADSNAKIKADMDRWWKEHGDEYVLQEGYEEFEKDLLAEEQELMDGPNGDPYHQPRNIISEALERVGADGLADRGIQTEIEENWRPGDLERTESDPMNGMRVFFDRLVKNGRIEKDLADRVISFGVPPGITEYLAGQDAMGPVAA